MKQFPFDPKRYPFSMEKHSIDIEFRLNRAKNELSELHNIGEHDQNLELLVDRLEALREEMYNNWNGRITWLIGSDYGFAKECVIWANNERGRR